MVAQQVLGRVLIVEDDPDLAALMRTVLEDEGYEVHVHADGDCFDAVRRFQPAAILCDYMLPRYDGRAVLQRLRHGLAPDTPVIMLSAAREPGASWRSWGADDFIAKPFDLDRLLAAVERAVGQDAMIWARERDRSPDERAS